MLGKYNIKILAQIPTRKAQIIDKLNRGLKLKMVKLLEAPNSIRYIDKLQDLIKSYNNTLHSTTKMKPIDALKLENYDLLITNCYNNFPIKVNSIKYEFDDNGRILIYLSSFTKEITGKWTWELFKIST